MANLTGKTLGSYLIKERLGKGGMAEVYKAYHPKLDRFVTVKILHSFLVEGQDFLARFEREARAVAGLRHAHIVQIYDYAVEDELYYMVMEYVDSGTLQEKLASLVKVNAYLPVEQVLSVLHQVGDALDYAHEQDIIHRDIKPSNILLDSQGNAFLTDFGIARMMSATQFTATGALIGTPTYMSPEQGQGLDLDAASDIYSLGIVLYEMLTGKVPFASDTPLAIIHKHIHEPLPRPSDLRPDLPASLEKVIYKAVEKDPGKRFKTAGAFYRALEKALTPDLIARLDAVDTDGARSVASLPTMRVEESQEPTKRSEMPTVAMGEQTIAEVTGGPASETEPELAPAPEPPAIPEGEPQKPVPQPADVKPKSKPSRPAAAKPAVSPVPEPRPTPPWLARLKSKPVVLAVIGLLVITALIFAFSSLSAGASCSGVDECMALREELWNQGDQNGALSAMDQAIDTVPFEEHPAYAWLWCDRAAMLDEMGDFDEANLNRETCAAWERGE